MRLISPREYAKKHGLSFQKVYRMIAAGDLPVVIHTRQVKRIPWDDERRAIVK